MATISELIQKIRTAVYGKDVRSAIADSIQKCYDDATSGAITIPDGSITAEKLADGAVTSDKIAAKSITNGKIADDGAIIKVLYNGAVVQDIQNRPNFADISTVVKDSISDDNSLDNNYPVNGFAVKNYVATNAQSSMQVQFSPRRYATLRINGSQAMVPTLGEHYKIDAEELPLATDVTAGAISAEDKAKLDLINLDDLSNIASISAETGGNYYGYVLRLTINGSTYRLPIVRPNGKLYVENMPVEDDIDNPSSSANPATISAIKNYINGNALNQPGYQGQMRIGISGTSYFLPMITNNKIAIALIPTTDTIASDGTTPVNGKAVYDYIEGLDIGAPTDAQVDSAVTTWMENNIEFYVDHDIDWDSTEGYIELHTYPDDPEMDTVLYAPLLATTSSVIASKYLPSATSEVKGAVIVDDELDDESTNPVQNAVIASEFDNLRSQISGGGLTADIKQALETLLSKVAYIDENGQDYLDALHVTMYPPANLVSISAVYTQSGTVYDTDSLDDLKTDLVVTAHYDDLSTETVTSYVLSGQLTAGTSTITVTYGGKTATFNVTVTGTYVTDGLIHKWDGINNTHEGHASNATLWADLVGNNDLEMPSNQLCSWTENALQCGVGYLDCIGGQISTGVATVEVVISDAPSSSTSCIAQFGSASRCCALFTDHTFTMKASSGTSFGTGFTDDSNVYSLVAVYSENSAAGSYYVNGQPAVIGSATHSITPQYTDRMRVGANANNTANYKFTGKIHAIRIYNKALTASEIAQNYSFDVSRFGLGE